MLVFEVLSSAKKLLGQLFMLFFLLFELVFQIIHDISFAS